MSKDNAFKSSRPEHLQYKDEGCDLAPSCLSCPFDDCRHESGGRRGVLAKVRNAEILQLSIEGKSIKELAQRFGVSIQSVRRALKSA